MTSHGGSTSAPALPPAWTLAGLAAAVVVVVGVWLFHGSSPHDEIPAVARIAQSVDATWLSVSTPIKKGDLLWQGKMNLVSGRVWIDFADGARVGISGPAAFSLKDIDRMRLERGMVAVYCPPGSEGFVVDTPGGTITDLGTEFGVAVDEAGVVETHVLAGQVAVRPTSLEIDQGGSQTLVAGQAGRFDTDDGMIESIPISPETFGSLRPLLGRNLIVNGDFEMDRHRAINQRPDGYVTLDYIAISGWHDEAKATTISYEHPEQVTFPRPGRDPVPTNHGRYFFMGGDTERVWQEIDVTALEQPINAGQIEFELTGWIGGVADQDDQLSVVARALDDGGNEVGALQIGPIDITERANRMGFWHRSQTGMLPEGTRRVRVEIVSESNVRVPGNILDSYADNLTLRLSIKTPAVGAKPKLTEQEQ